MLVADSTKFTRRVPARIAHIRQIQTFMTDSALPAGLANICHSRGIQVIEAMPKQAADIEDTDTSEGASSTRPISICRA
jgi:DeoR family glycerol-3-phosphate regulon repressor